MSGVEAAVEKLRRALALSTSSSLHLLEVQAPRVLAEVLRAWKDPPRVVGLTPGDMDDASRLTPRVLGALLADDGLSAPVLVDASAAWSLSDSDAWTECLHRWNERRDRVIVTRRAPVVFAAPPWLARRLSSCAPDLWSVRGPSVSVDDAPTPRLAWEDRARLRNAAFFYVDAPRSTLDDEEAAARGACRGDAFRPSVSKRSAALALDAIARRRYVAHEVGAALEDLRLAIETLTELRAQAPSDEESASVLTSALFARASVLADRESHRDALDDVRAIQALRSTPSRIPIDLGDGLLEPLGACVRSVEPTFLLHGASAARDAWTRATTLLESMSHRPWNFDDILNAAYALGMRLGVFAKDLDVAIDAAGQAHDLAFPAGAHDFRPALAELHLDRGDDLRARSVVRSIDASDAASTRRFIVALALIAHTAGDAGEAMARLVAARAVSRRSDVPYEDAEAALLATEVSRALGDADEEAHWTDRARVELDHLRRVDPDAPRTRRLLARWRTLSGR